MVQQRLKKGKKPAMFVALLAVGKKTVVKQIFLTKSNQNYDFN